LKIIFILKVIKNRTKIKLIKIRIKTKIKLIMNKMNSIKTKYNYIATRIKRKHTKEI